MSNKKTKIRLANFRVKCELPIEERGGIHKYYHNQDCYRVYGGINSVSEFIDRLNRNALPNWKYAVQTGQDSFEIWECVDQYYDVDPPAKVIYTCTNVRFFEKN